MRRFDAVCLAGHPFDMNLHDGCILYGVIFKRRRGSTWRELVNHHLQNPPFFLQSFHKLRFSETHDTFVDLTCSAAAIPCHLRAGLVHQETHAWISVKCLHLLPSRPAMKVYAIFGKQVVYWHYIWAILGY